MDLSFILQWLGTWTGIISTIITSTGVIFIAFKKIMKKLQPHLEILENLKKLTSTVESISKEFKPNSGSSLSDKISSLQRDVKSNMEMTNSIANRQKWLTQVHDEPIFETNNQGECVFVNEAYLKLVQRPKEEVLMNGWKNNILEEKRDEINKFWREAIQEKRNFEHTLIISDKFGKKFSVHCIAMIQPDLTYIGSYTKIKELSQVSV